MGSAIEALADIAGEASLRRRQRELAAMLAQRKMEGLSLYRPLPYLEPFHECRKKWRIATGSNRSSKTFTCAAEAARAFCGCDPYDKYPRNNGNALVVSRDGDGLAMLWRKMASPGEFKCIQDEHTGLWRAVRPDPNDPYHLDPYDAANKEKWRDSPPLLPSRMIRSIAWEDKSKGIPRCVAFENGWQSLWRSCGGSAKPPQGDRYNFVFFDEEIDNPQFFEEAVRGLVQVIPNERHKPVGVWSATAQVSAPQFLNLREEAENGSETVAVFEALIVKNPFISDEERKSFYDTLSPEEREARYFGKAAIAARRIYRDYSSERHSCEPFPVPDDWCLYAIVDPGTQRAGTALIAVDPDELHLWVVEAWELLQADAIRWAARLAESLRGRCVEAVICDLHAGAQHSMGATRSVAKHYYDAMIAAGIEPRRKGPLDGLFKGDPDVEAREQSLIACLVDRDCEPGTGTPKLQVFRGCCDTLEREILRANNLPKPGTKRGVRRDPRQPHDVLDCLEYAAAHNPRYFSPPERKAAKPDQIYEAWKDRHKPSTKPIVL